ncbi:restriction endonuclease subunit S [Collinsella tanakaei]|uniref:restriction endonuclease subunit S n=1 Tax=Collinsella tanakaei TaxID=626935 RepID=UPI0026F2C8E3|nr:restriction endonuclease subunit S [Collinsella tanakaei]
MSTEFFTKEVFSKELRTYKLVERNQLAYNPSRINVGSIALQDIADEVVVSPLYIVFAVDASRIDSSYLLRYLKSRPGLKQVEFNSIGTVRNNLKYDGLCQISVPLPSLEVQRSRVRSLIALETEIKEGEETLSKLDVLVKSRFAEMFGDPVDGKKWASITLDELCSKLGSGATPRGGKAAYKAEGVPLIRSMNVHNGHFEWKDLAHIDGNQAEKLKGVTLLKGDVLLNITGASVARSCLLPDELVGGRVNQHVSIVRVDQNRMLPIFLNAVLVSDSYQNHLLDGSKMAGATREAITKDDLKKMTVPLPPLALQQEFADFAAQVDKSRFVVRS